MQKYSFSKLMLVYVLWLLSWSLAASLFEVYFFNLGLSFPQIYFADSLWFFGSLLVIPLFSGFRSRNFMLAGILIAFAATSILYFEPVPAAAYLFRFVIGLTNLFFWAPFNTIFYEYRKNDNATLGAIYYAVTPLISLFIPAFAGVFASALGFPLLYLLSMACFVVTFVAAYLLIEDKAYKYTMDACIKAISGLRTLIFMEGFAAAIISAISLDVMLLLFASTPTSFGIFTSLITVFAVLASIVTAKLSDKVQKRRDFILPVVALFAISTFIAGSAHDALTFFIGFGLVSFFSRIFFPLPFALVVDNSKSLVESMVGREIYLNLGRLCGGVLGYLLLVNTDIRTVIIFQSVTLLAYIPIFENRKRKLSRQ